MKRIVRSSLLWRGLQALYSPGRVISKLLGITPFVPFSLKCALDAFPRPYYAYGVVQAARLAQKLDIKEIAVIEFGVGRGEGLIKLELLQEQITGQFDVAVRVFGFDLGEGLPAPKDFRDCPYLWRRGLFRMEKETLQKRLKHATLVIGDVGDTVERFFSTYSPPPIGFISFDMDYYSSTVSALELLRTTQIERFLPRTLCYFDDVVGADEACHSEYDGELLAIKEFNSAAEDRKIAKIHGLAHKRIAYCYWADQMYALHFFSHPQYNQFVHPEAV
ncbi:MAG TPA: hypothetical protein VIE89_15270 [Candidatus Binatia bacterium]|jgi:hypothetical protein